MSKKLNVYRVRAIANFEVVAEDKDAAGAEASHQLRRALQLEFLNSEWTYKIDRILLKGEFDDR